MHFHIVTPCVAPDTRLLHTAWSVVSQSILEDSVHSISYVVQIPLHADEPHFDVPPRDNLSVVCRREADSGVYDALARGFADAMADIYCYVGSGDYLSPYALEIVAEVMADGPEWVTGIICGYNDRHHLVETLLPFRYRRRLIKAGFYGWMLPFLQQESTFWNERLHRLVDWQHVAEFRVAGDALIWRSLAEHADLSVIEAWLGGFEHREGQLSTVHADLYQQELRAACESRRAIDLLSASFDWVFWRAPRRIKRALDPTRYVYDFRERRYRRMSERLL